MQKIAPYLLIALAAGGLIAAYYFLIYKPGQDVLAQMEGAPCTINAIPGTVKNGICVPAQPKQEPLPCGGILNPC